MATNREIIDVSVRGARKAQSSLKGLGSAALKLGGAFFAAKGIVKGMSTVVQSGSQLKSVEMAFNNMGSEIGFSEGSLKKLQDATDGTVSKLELMTKANNAMALGIVESDDQMAEMFDTAQKLGKALGQDTVSALDSLVTGMGRQSKLMLDNLGIMVNTEKAYDDYAASIGKSTSELTDNEKKIAFNNAAMAEATRIANSMGEEQITTADKISKLKNTFMDMASSVGSSADGMFGSVVDAAQGVASKVAAGLDFAKTIDWKSTATNLMDNLGVVYEAMRQISVLAFEFLVQNVKKIVVEIPDYFMIVVDWLKNDLWAFIKNVGTMIWEPISLGAKIVALSVQLKFQEMWNSMKQQAVDGINSMIEAYNFMREKLGFEPVPLMMDVDDDNVQETTDKIAALKEQFLETDLGGAIFGSKEDQVDTFEEFNAAMADIVTTATNQIIVQNEKQIVSDNKVNQNKDDILKKTEKRQKTEAKLNQAAFDENSKMFKSHLEQAGSEYAAFQELDKAMKIRDILIGIPPTVRDAYAAGMKAGGPAGPVVGAAFAATAFAAQMAQLNKIRKAQYGANFVTEGPEMLMVGEGSGAEHVQVTPLSDNNIDGGPNQRPINLRIEGNVMHESFIQDDVIPAIREGLRLGENLGN